MTQPARMAGESAGARMRPPSFSTWNFGGVEKIIGSGRPGRYHVDEISSEPLPSGHTSRRWGMGIKRADGNRALSQTLGQATYARMPSEPGFAQTTIRPSRGGGVVQMRRRWSRSRFLLRGFYPRPKLE